MEGLEELNLSDLKFDDANDVFDVFKTKDKGDGSTPNIEDPNKKTTDSEGNIIIKDPESVASEKDSQGKDGKTADDNSSNSSSPQTGNSKMFSSLAAQLKSKGVLPNLDLTKTEIKSLDDINDAIKAEVSGRLNSKQQAIEKAMNLGLDAGETAEQLDTIGKLKSISPDWIAKPENDKFRKDVMIQDFINNGYDKTRADVMAQRSIDAGTGVEDAKFALDKIITREEGLYTDKINAAEKKEQKDITDIKSLIDKDEEILPGVKLDSQQRDAIYKQITTDLGNKENAFIRAQKQDPIGSRIKLETLFHLTKGLTDFSLFTQGKVNETNKNFEQLLQGSSFGEEGDGDSSSGNDDSFTLADLKDLKFE